MTTDGDLDPLGFVWTMENEFIGRNWNEDWWDMGCMGAAIMICQGRKLHLEGLLAIYN